VNFKKTSFDFFISKLSHISKLFPSQPGVQKLSWPLSYLQPLRGNATWIWSTRYNINYMKSVEFMRPRREESSKYSLPISCFHQTQLSSQSPAFTKARRETASTKSKNIFDVSNVKIYHFDSHARFWLLERWDGGGCWNENWSTKRATNFHK